MESFRFRFSELSSKLRNWVITTPFATRLLFIFYLVLFPFSFIGALNYGTGLSASRIISSRGLLIYTLLTSTLFPSSFAEFLMGIVMLPLSFLPVEKRLGSIAALFQYYLLSILSNSLFLFVSLTATYVFRKSNAIYWESSGIFGVSLGLMAFEGAQRPSHSLNIGNYAINLPQTLVVWFMASLMMLVMGLRMDWLCHLACGQLLANFQLIQLSREKIQNLEQSNALFAWMVRYSNFIPVEAASASQYSTLLGEWSDFGARANSPSSVGVYQPARDAPRATVEYERTNAVNYETDDVGEKISKNSLHGRSTNSNELKHDSALSTQTPLNQQVPGQQSERPLLDLSQLSPAKPQNQNQQTSLSASTNDLFGETIVADEKLLNRLCSLGIEQKKAKTALEKNGNDYSAAVRWLRENV